MKTRSNPVYCGIDTIDLAQATKLIQSIAGGTKPAVGGIKLGLEFFLAHGAPGVRYAFPAPVRATGVGFFLDLKLHDIPNTVAGGIRAVVELAPTFITIHASGGRDMLKAAVEEAATQAAKHHVSRPPLAWMVMKVGSSSTTARMPPATVLGMSCSLRSRKKPTPVARTGAGKA